MKRLLCPRAIFQYEQLSKLGLQTASLDSVDISSQLDNTMLAAGHKLEFFNATQINITQRFESLIENPEQLQNALTTKEAIFVLVSKHSAFLLLALLKRFDITAKAHFVCVGKTTASVLLQTGLPETKIEIAKPENSQGLLALDTMQGLSDKIVCLINGEQGLDYIENALRTQNANLEVLSLYKREPRELGDALAEQYNNLVTRHYDAIVALSVETLSNFHKAMLLQNDSECLERVCKLPVLVLSQRIANAASDMAYVNVDVVSRESLLDSISLLK